VVKVLPPLSPVFALPGVDQQRGAIAELHLGHHGADPFHHRGATGPRRCGGCERADSRERGRERGERGWGRGRRTTESGGEHGGSAMMECWGRRGFWGRRDGGAAVSRHVWKDSRIWRGGSAEE
jgi:hypothetical protein